jgi:hypothetical protein
MLTTRESGRPDTAADREGIIPCSIDSGEIDAFARRAVTCDSDTLVEEVHRLLAGGVTHEDLLLKLLAPAARRLGKMWDDDSCDFADVTIGLMKLHRVLERVNAEGPSGMGAGGNSPRVLLAPAPGEQHVFGIVMVGEFFSRSATVSGRPDSRVVSMRRGIISASMSLSRTSSEGGPSTSSRRELWPQFFQSRDACVARANPARLNFCDAVPAITQVLSSPMQMAGKAS